MIRSVVVTSLIAALSLPPCVAAVAPNGTSSGSRMLAEGLVTLSIPDPEWRLEQDASKPPRIARLIDADGATLASFSLQPLPDYSFEFLTSIVERSVSAKYEGFRKIEADTSEVDGRPVFRLEGAFQEEGVTVHAEFFFTAAGGQLFGLALRVPPDRLPEVRDRLDRLVAGMVVEGRGLVAN